MAKASGEGGVIHYGAVRLRVNGSGNLQMRLISLDEVKERVLVPIAMSTLTNKEPNRLTNFTQQRAQLEIKTTEMDEVFNISKIVIFIKPVATSFPSMS
jgi:hypothetical protein